MRDNECRSRSGIILDALGIAGGGEGSGVVRFGLA